MFAALLAAGADGQYVGTWTSDNAVNSGKVNLILNLKGDSEFTFTYQDQPIKPKKVTTKVNDNQVEFICELDFDGLKLKNVFRGTIDGKSIAGKYQSTSAEDGSVLDTGTWTVTQQ